MAILNAENEERSQTSASPRPFHKPPLFMRTIVPKGAINHSISCSLLPPHALSRAFSSRKPPPALKSCRQLVTSTGVELHVFTVDDDTLSLQPLTSLMLHSPIYDIAVVSSPVPGRDILVVLSNSANILFLQFDDSTRNLRCTGQFCVVRPAPTSIDTPRLMVTHPSRRLVAVSSFGNTISVFPVLFLLAQITAGFVVSAQIEGTVLSLAFLEDDDSGVVGEAILIALIQKGNNQYIEVFAVGVADSTGGLSIVSLGSMVTCASRSEDLPVERARYKLFGEPLRPSPSAVGVAPLSGCPFQFAVFARGKVIAVDARNVILKRHSRNEVPTSMRLEDDVVRTRSPHYNPSPSSPGPSKNSMSAPLSPLPNSSNSDMMRTPEGQMIPRPNTSEQQYSTPTGSDAGHSGDNDGFITPVQSRIRLEPPAAPIQTRRSRSSRDDVIPIGILGRRGLNANEIAKLKPGEDYLRYLFKPESISLDTGYVNGVATAWVDARDHFHNVNDCCNGLYFVTESGAVYVLRWSNGSMAGSTTFTIQISVSDESSRKAASRQFCLDYVGDVGPTVSLASLDRELLFIATDCFDASLRRVHPPSPSSPEQNGNRRFPVFNRSRGRCDGGRYGLEVRQEFLNLSPISDFAFSKNGNVSFEKSSSSSLAVHPQVDENIAGLTASPDPILKDSKLALNRVLDGAPGERDLIVCSGIGRYGSVRWIRPGSPVNIYASSDPTFTACNDMWSLQFTSSATHDSAIVFSFAEATRLLLSVPSPDLMSSTFELGKAPMVGSLIDGTESSGLVTTTRSIRVGLLQDGVIAQIHARGVRLVNLKNASEIELSDLVINGVLSSNLYEAVADWLPPDDSFISVGAIRGGFVAISVIHKKSMKGTLVLLKYVSNSSKHGWLTVVSSTDLEHELSCIEIPDWFDNNKSTVASTGLPPIAILGTYEPSVEARLLGPTLEVVCKRQTFPWTLEPHGSFSQKGSTMTRAAPDLLGNRGKASAIVTTSKTTSDLEPSNVMVAVPESLCAVTFDGKKVLCAGLRDGSVMSFSFDEYVGKEGTESGSSSEVRLVIIGHRKLGHRPVTLKEVDCAVGHVIIGATDRPWMYDGSSRQKHWVPLAFNEIQALSSYSVPGANRCFGTVADDNVFYICGIRRISEVSVESIYIGATPRRVLSLHSPPNHILVASSYDPDNASEESIAMESEKQRDSSQLRLTRTSELRLYDSQEKELKFYSLLMDWEYVHFLENWGSFIVVGTSIGKRSYYDTGSEEKCKWGRLLLFMATSRTMDLSNKDASTGAKNSPAVALALCSEVILPGAVLAGAVSTSDDVLVISCNQEVLVFTNNRPHSVLVEVARVSARMLVVGLSIKDDIVSVIDQKDSICFYQLRVKPLRLVRDRSDHKRRAISDAILIDRTLAVATDHSGGFFSIGYEEEDDPPLLQKGLRAAAMRVPLLRATQQIENQNSVERLAWAESLGLVGPLDDNYEAMNTENDFELPDEMLEAVEAHEQPEATVTQANPAIPGVIGLPSPPFMGIGNQLIAADIQMEPEADIPFIDEVGDDDAFMNEVDDIGGNGGDIAINNEAEGAEDILGIENGANADDAVTNNNASGNSSSEKNRIPRNLVSHHSFALRDIALRVRIGSFSRAEQKSLGKLVGLSEGPRHPDENVIMLGTVGGAITTAVAMSAESYVLLSKIEGLLRKQSEITGDVTAGLDNFRALYGPRAVGVVDGDLLRLFEGLNYNHKLGIADMVGNRGERGVLYIEGLINDLCDRVG